MQRSSSGIVDRARRVVQLDQRVFDEIAHDPAATREAAIVVAVVAVASAIGGAADGVNGIIVGVIGAILGWLIFAGMAWFFGTNIFGTPTTSASAESMLRTLGYAQAPNVLAIFGFIPVLGWLAALLGSIWSVVVAIVAIRQTLQISTGRAIITAVLAWIALAIVSVILSLAFDIDLI